MNQFTPLKKKNLTSKYLLIDIESGLHHIVNEPKALLEVFQVATSTIIMVWYSFFKRHEFKFTESRQTALLDVSPNRLTYCLDSLFS